MKKKVLFMGSSAIILVFIFSCETRTSKVIDFDCQQFWLPESVDWSIAYDSVYFCSETLLMRDNNENWAMLIPGSLTKSNDTIWVNQELGYSNQCHKIGALPIGVTKIINSTNKQTCLIRESDSTIRMNNIQYKKSKYIIKYGCSCSWN